MLLGFGGFWSIRSMVAFEAATDSKFVVAQKVWSGVDALVHCH
jgi:hypothetical protein